MNGYVKVGREYVPATADKPEAPNEIRYTVNGREKVATFPSRVVASFVPRKES